MLERKIILSLLLIGFLGSCVKKQEVPIEPVKELAATWRIQNVTRNTIDITQFIDSAGFRLVLSSDNTFKLEGNNIPFVVNSASGKWLSDDPQYPYGITFTPTDSTTSFQASLATPVSKGERTLKITFSPGCHSNTYVYTFEKAN